MKIKTSELTGAALDWAIAKCEGYAKRGAVRAYKKGILVPSVTGAGCIYSPSTDWSQGGPIIEREIISIIEGSNGEWQAGKRPYKFFYGATPLIAAMRCYVASRLGDEVDVPEELV